jgi:hypothetical protein
MAWSIGEYNDFLEVVRDAFGVDRDEAADLYRDMRDVLDIGPLTVADLEEYADVASDLIAPDEGELIEELDFFPDVPPLEWDYEFDWQDEWLDEGEEIEITADVHYED